MVADDDLLTEAEILQRQGWTVAQFRQARLLNFPPCLWETIKRERQQRLLPVWPVGAVDQWVEAVRSLRLG